MKTKRARAALERWESILAATRRLGRDNRSAVARAADVHRTTVSKAWTKGWPEHDLPPIDEALAGDAAAARAILAGGGPAEAATIEEAKRIQAHVDAELVRVQAREDAAGARAEEAQGVRVFRRNAIALGGAVAQLTRVMLKLPAKLEEAIERDAAKLSAKEIVSLMRGTTRVAKESVEAMRTEMVIERLLLGEPGEIVEVRDGDLSEEEAVAWLERASRTLERREKFKKWGELELVQGGKRS